MGRGNHRVGGRDPAKSPESSSARWGAAVLGLLALAACSRPPRPAVAAAALPPAPAGGPCLRLDAAHSDVRVLVYRAGPLAQLGHNHVLVAHALAGELCAGRFALTVPVAALAVDPAAARAEEGVDFATVPSAADVAGTREHLLGASQLGADAWPVIRVSGTLPAGAGPVAVAARLEVRGILANVAVPTSITVDPEGRMVVAGGFELAQTSLGLVPYSVALGALRVRDEVAVRFRLVAVQDGDPPMARP